MCGPLYKSLRETPLTLLSPLRGEDHGIVEYMKTQNALKNQGFDDTLGVWLGAKNFSFLPFYFAGSMPFHFALPKPPIVPPNHFNWVLPSKKVKKNKKFRMSPNFITTNKNGTR